VGVLVRMVLLSSKQGKWNNTGSIPVSLGVDRPKSEHVSIVQKTARGLRKTFLMVSSSASD